MSLFLPALPLALPDSVFSLRGECEKEECLEQQNLTVVLANEQNNNEMADHHNNTGTEDQHNNTGTTDQQRNQAILPEQEASDHITNIPVDDASPITFSTLLFECAQKMPYVGLYFNIKFFLVYVFVFPFFIYLQFGLYNTFKKIHINESVKKGISVGEVFTKHAHWSIFVTLGLIETAWIWTSTLTSLVIILFLRTEDLFFKQGFICLICSIYRRDTETRGSHRSLGDEMRLHFEKVPDILWKVIPYFAKSVTFNI